MTLATQVKYFNFNSSNFHVTSVTLTFLVSQPLCLHVMNVLYLFTFYMSSYIMVHIHIFISLTLHSSDVFFFCNPYLPFRHTIIKGLLCFYYSISVFMKPTIQCRN
jgi:hypothetical protein